jgi:hypothetical protein
VGAGKQHRHFARQPHHFFLKRLAILLFLNADISTRALDIVRFFNLFKRCHGAEVIYNLNLAIVKSRKGVSYFEDVGFGKFAKTTHFHFAHFASFNKQRFTLLWLVG